MSTADMTPVAPNATSALHGVESEKDREARFYMRHVVPLYFDLRKGTDRRQVVHTAFVFSVCGGWLLLTAGHAITEIREAREAGYELLKCKILDCLG